MADWNSIVDGMYHICWVQSPCGNGLQERIDKILGQTNVGVIICINSVYSS